MLLQAVSAGFGNFTTTFAALLAAPGGNTASITPRNNFPGRKNRDSQVALQTTFSKNICDDVLRKLFVVSRAPNTLKRTFRTAHP